MSNLINDMLYERAAFVNGEFEGTDVELAVNKAIADNDLERLEYLVSNAEAELSRQEFNFYDIY